MPCLIARWLPGESLRRFRQWALRFFCVWAFNIVAAGFLGYQALTNCRSLTTVTATVTVAEATRRSPTAGAWSQRNVSYCNVM